MGCGISTKLLAYKHKHNERNTTALNIRNYSQSEIVLQTIEMICCIKIDFECKTFGLGRKSTTQLELTIFSGVERESGRALMIIKI